MYIRHFLWLARRGLIRDNARGLTVGLSTMQTNATRRMQCIIQIKLAVQCDFREFDGRPINLGYRPPTLDLGHTLLR